jgi:hypothetical protein
MLMAKDGRQLRAFAVGSYVRGVYPHHNRLSNSSPSMVLDMSLATS